MNYTVLGRTGVLVSELCFGTMSFGMGIPNEIKIGILGAGGKMGMRISANLKKLRNEIFFIENAEIGIKRL